jgi:hypothetical protein
MSRSSMGASFIASSQGGFEPQRQNNWVIEIEITNREVLELSLSKGFLPKEMNEPIAIHYLNEIVYVAGKTSYEEGTIEVIDYVDQNTANVLASWRQLVYQAQTGFIGPASAYKKRGTVVLFSTDGTVERKFDLIGMWPHTVDFGTLDMASSETLKAIVTIRFDKAIPFLA